MANFQTTRWSMVLSARDGAGRALDELCALYWFPVYAFVRRRGHQAAEALDLTQGFFADLLERRALAGVDPARGRFRSFVLAACAHFLSHEREREHAQKRGAGATHLSFDLERAELRYAGALADSQTPESEFERQWARSVLAAALERLRAEQGAAGQGERFEQLKGFLTGGEEEKLAPMAATLGLSETALKVAIHRLRRRYREAVRAEIRDTLPDAALLDEEMAHLMAALRGR